MRKLVSWGAGNMRQFPWRKRRAAYRVLLAEKLLQQTAARTAVVEAYRQLIAYCPTPAYLACADVRKLEKIVRPLGFVYRANELKRLGKALTVVHNGRVPDDLRRLLDLPGVGQYAARAVLSFAFEQRVPIVDNNVARFLHRFFGIRSPIPANPARSSALLKLAADIMPPGKSSAFNFALLDLCAAICTPNAPKCEICPLRSACFTGQLRLSTKRTTLQPTRTLA